MTMYNMVLYKILDDLFDILSKTKENNECSCKWEYALTYKEKIFLQNLGYSINYLSSENVYKIKW